MGTNYYVIDESKMCKHCGVGSEEIHLGKSSYGWCFALHVYPEQNINNLEDIIAFIGDKQIKNEYDDNVNLEEFLDIVTNRTGHLPEKSYRHSSWQKFHRKNHSEIGPNGLLRINLSDFCVGHGEGTYDYLVGYFS